MFGTNGVAGVEALMYGFKELLVRRGLTAFRPALRDLTTWTAHAATHIIHDQYYHIKL
jgi:hypothetical protein